MALPTRGVRPEVFPILQQPWPMHRAVAKSMDEHGDRKGSSPLACMHIIHSHDAASFLSLSPSASTTGVIVRLSTGVDNTIEVVSWPCAERESISVSRCSMDEAITLMMSESLPVTR